MKKSIMPDMREGCYICGFQRGLEMHHVWHGIANRKLSDKDGLIVPLCHHHHQGKAGIHHGNVALDIYLRKIAEVAWIRKENANVDCFIRRYGANVLETDEIKLVDEGITAEDFKRRMDEQSDFNGPPYTGPGNTLQQWGAVNGYRQIYAGGGSEE